MALKDWKKISEPKWIRQLDKRQVIQWRNKKGRRIGIIKGNTGIWWFKYESGGVARGKKFKTKQQALKYAKEYMKK